MSATLYTEKFRTYLHGAPRIKVPGRKFPVEVFYTAKTEWNYVEAAVCTALQIHMYEGPGDILIFLTGKMDINQTCNNVRNESSSNAAHDLNGLVI